MDRRRALLSVRKSVPEGIDINNYLTIEALADGLTASLAADVVQYCVDGSGEWKELRAGEATEAINAGQTLSFKAAYTAYNNNRRFTISESCNVLGDPMSLYYGDKAKDYTALPYSYAFAYLFYNCSTIIDATGLILDRTLKTYAYAYMFYGCSALTHPPELPQKSLQASCYRYMFRNCSNLLRSPKLPALTLRNYCYEYMFTTCKKLLEITMLATDKSASNCMLGWVSAVKSSGTFYKNKNATWTTTGVSGVPSGWTVVKVDPNLPITLYEGAQDSDTIQDLINLANDGEYLGGIYTYTFRDGDVTIKTSSEDYPIAAMDYNEKTNTLYFLPVKDDYSTHFICRDDNIRLVIAAQMEALNVTLHEGDNGQAGMDVYDYLMAHRVSDGFINWDWSATENDNLKVDGLEGIARVERASKLADYETWTLKWTGMNDWHFYELYSDGYLSMYSDD